MEGDGELKAPRRAHLEALAASGDPEAMAELASIPELPPLAAHLWVHFADLCSTRQSGGMGPSPLSRVEVQAWERDEGVELEPWERRAIFRLDSAWMQNQAEQMAKPAAAR